MNNPVKVLAECLLDALTDWYLGDARRFEYHQGKVDAIREIMIKNEINKDDLIGGLEDSQFVDKLASKILGGDRA
jgi:hypothetical protein